MTIVVLAVKVVVLAVTVVVEAVVHAVVVVQPIFLAVAVVVVLKTDVVRDYCPYLARLAEAEVVVSVVVAAEILTS